MKDILRAATDKLAVDPRHYLALGDPRSDNISEHLERKVGKSPPFF